MNSQSKGQAVKRLLMNLIIILLALWMVQTGAWLAWFGIVLFLAFALSSIYEIILLKPVKDESNAAHMNIGRRRNDAVAQRKIDDLTKEYAHGPVGTWVSYLDDSLGSGFSGTGLMGSELCFKADGSGYCKHWSAMHGDSLERFVWQSIGDNCIEYQIENADEGGILKYQFYMLEGSKLFYLEDVYESPFVMNAHAPLIRADG